jgi:hypothetical protein
MKISLQATILIGVLFSVASFAVAITGFASLGDIDDPAQVADGWGYACFWAFLGAVAAATATGAWWMSRGTKRAEDA